ncbi:MAG: hypothetical protein U5N55_01655 [Cypionkella sp.]|nr:hypothetical protein [Cypionkella sp.]
MAIREADIQAQIMMALSEAGCLIFRNNCGVLPDRRGIPVRFGVGGNGGSDLLGICPDGKFLSVEVKTALGQPTDAQLHFIAAVIARGGRAGIARCAQDALKIALD